MDRSKDSDPHFAFERHSQNTADVIAALIFDSAKELKSYWEAWPHWDKQKGIALPKGHDLEGFHVIPPEQLSQIRQGSIAGLLAHQGDLEWLMDVVWDIKHHDDSRPIPLPVETADPYWQDEKWAGCAQAVICGMWLSKEIIEQVQSNRGKSKLKSVLHRLPDLDIIKQNVWFFQQIKGLNSVEIIVVKGGTSKFNPTTRKNGNQTILSSFKWERESNSNENL